MDFGIQTFTIRKEQKKSIRAAYLPLIELGIRRFEVARMDFTRENADQLRALIDAFGIEIVSIQVKPKHVFLHSDAVVDFCNITGCKNVVISMLPFGCILGKEQKFYSFVASLDAACEAYAKRGITLAYHHHNWEYIKLSNGKRRMDELLARTEKIKFVHDTYWTAKCGIDPARQIRDFGDRLLGIHLRDLTFKKRGLDVLGVNAAIGDGVIDFASVLSAARAVGCEYTVIEQKTKAPYRDIRSSLEKLKLIAESMV
jgi:sugar phosphate isomerase/epimerase